MSGLTDAKFQGKTRLQSLPCIFAFVEIEFAVAYGGRHYLTTLTTTKSEGSRVPD